jgi:hypothetical protein
MSGGVYVTHRVWSFWQGGALRIKFAAGDNGVDGTHGWLQIQIDGVTAWGPDNNGGGFGARQIDLIGVAAGAQIELQWRNDHPTSMWIEALEICTSAQSSRLVSPPPDWFLNLLEA